MELKKETLRLSFAVLFALVFVGLLVFFPRPSAFQMYESLGSSHFDYTSFFTQYKNNIGTFFQNMWAEKSLGMTRFEFTRVEDELLRYFPKSLLVIVISFLLSISLGMYKGIFDYKNMHSRKNIFGNGTTWLFQSIPDFFLVIIAFYIAFYYLPRGIIFSNNNWYSFVAPSLLVSIYPIMYVARLTCVSLLHQDGQDYIRTAFAKGHTIKQVIHKHILRNSLTDMGSQLPTIIIIIISNLLMVEYLTGYAGAGNRLFVAMGGRQKEIGFSTGNFEAELVLGFALCFMATILLVHILKIMLLVKLNKKGS